MIETFVSFVIFVVNDIRLSNSGYPQESLKPLLLMFGSGPLWT